MDPVLLTISFKGIGMLLAFAVGFMTVRYGYHLFKDGAGHGKEKLAIKFGKTNINAHSVGSVVMSTGIMWGIIGASLSPDFINKGGDIEISSLTLPVSTFDSFTLASDTIDNPEIIVKDLEQLKKLFALTVLLKSSDFKDNNWIKLKGKTPVISTYSTSYLKSEDGRYFITADAETNTDVAKVAFTPSINKQNQIVFKLDGVSRISER